MANNIDFISSIKIDTDFEQVVRQLVAHIFDARAYIVNGPYDGGLDLVTIRAGVEVREVIQISIQEAERDAKVLADAKKAKKLVDEHQYPDRMLFFYSRKMTNTAKNKLVKDVRDQFSITLMIYDATVIDQIITDEAPHILKFLIQEIHKYDGTGTAPLDPRARALYDYLALGKDAAQFKTSILEAQILSSLAAGSLAVKEFYELMAKSGVKRGVAEARISRLLIDGKISLSDDHIGLSSDETIRVGAILAKDVAEKSDLLRALKKYCDDEIGVDISIAALDVIKELYALSIDIQLSELDFEPPRLGVAKAVLQKLKAIIIERAKVSDVDAERLAKGLLSVGAANEYLSTQCSSLLCLSLLKQKRLEAYIKERTFFIYLDATVYIRYLALFTFKDVQPTDREMQVTAKLKEVIKTLPSAKIFVSKDHLEETVRHIEQAEKISKFANDTIIRKFGESKNVYFNLFLQEKQKRANYTFDVFLEKLIGYESEYGIGRDKFAKLLDCVSKYNENAKVGVRDNQAAKYDQLVLRVCNRYEAAISKIGKRRKHRTAMNDVTTCTIMTNGSLHLDAKKVGHIPMFITWDSTQHLLREIFREEYAYSEWLIYSPQRAVERFSMLDFGMKSGVIKDAALAILEEDYLRDSSLVDTLAVFLGDNQIEADAIISVVTKLSNRLHGEGSDAAEFEIDEKNTIVEALVHIQNQFWEDFESVRHAFADPANESDIVSMFTAYLSEAINKDGLSAAVRQFIKKEGDNQSTSNN